jgi:uncharacterized protein YbcI
VGLLLVIHKKGIKKIEGVREAIAKSVADSYGRYYGKRPLYTHVHIDEGFVFCLLYEPFTPVERTLINIGQLEAVREARQAFEAAMTEEFERTIEELVGQAVVAFVSQIHVNPDLQVAMFQLASKEKDPFERLLDE